MRVFFYLVARPQDILNYCRYGPFSKRSPLELGIPWWSFGAVKFLGGRLRADQEVFEFGSGGSTIFIGSKVRSLTCVEDERQWVDHVVEAAAKRGLKGVSVLYRPFDFWKTESFGQSDYLLALDGRSYDVIVVDGKEWSDQVRDQCFWRAEDHIKKGGLIILDDAWRYPQLKNRNRALRWREFKGLGYFRAGVTSTAVFEY
jgi:predicted O-methyltransferase YrrM